MTVEERLTAIEKRLDAIEAKEKKVECRVNGYGDHRAEWDRLLRAGFTRYARDHETRRA